MRNGIKIVWLESIARFCSKTTDRLLDDQFFQKNNRPLHRCSVVEKWKEEHGMRFIFLPPHNPELNPIENVWVAFKRQQLRSMQTSSMEILAETVPRIWSWISPSYIKMVYQSPAKRIDYCVNVRAIPLNFDYSLLCFLLQQYTSSLQECDHFITPCNMTFSPSSATLFQKRNETQEKLLESFKPNRNFPASSNP